MHGTYSAPHNYHDIGLTRAIAHRIKKEEPAAVEIAAKELSKYIPANCVLVPMPSHNGVPADMKRLCKEIAKITNSSVIYAIQGKERERNYDVKKRGGKLTELNLEFKQVKPLPNNKDIIIIDNVVDSGLSALAACHALQDGIVLAYAKTTNEKLKGLFFIEPERLKIEIEKRQFLRSMQPSYKQP